MSSDVVVTWQLHQGTSIVFICCCDHNFKSLNLYTRNKSWFVFKTVSSKSEIVINIQTFRAKLIQVTGLCARVCACVCLWLFMAVPASTAVEFDLCLHLRLDYMRSSRSRKRSWKVVWCQTPFWGVAAATATVAAGELSLTTKHIKSDHSRHNQTVSAWSHWKLFCGSHWVLGSLWNLMFSLRLTPGLKTSLQVEEADRAESPGSSAVSLHSNRSMEHPENFHNVPGDLQIE